MEELERMAGAKGLDVAAFANQYVRRVNHGFSLRERIINGEHFCCFFDPISCRCAVYENRPKQCRTFPFWEKFREEYRELFLECPGVSLK